MKKKLIVLAVVVAVIVGLLAYYQYDVALINLLSICGIPEAFQQYRVEGVTEII